MKRYCIWALTDDKHWIIDYKAEMVVGIVYPIGNKVFCEARFKTYLVEQTVYNSGVYVSSIEEGRTRLEAIAKEYGYIMLTDRHKCFL